MKVAVCLHGYFGTLSENNFTTSQDGLKHISESVLSKVDNVDFYVHCWQPEFKDEILNLYNPKASIFEDQIDFNSVCAENKIYQNYIDEHFPRKKTMYKNAIASRILSFYYSRCKSLELALKNDYDWILTTRFDISARGGSEVNRIRFLHNHDTGFLYTADWDQKNVGYGDMWFYGSPEIMKQYSQIYSSALTDFKPFSKYEKTLTNAWPDSNFYNVNDFNDQRQFTNEIDKKEKSKNLMRFPKWRMTDSHLHHKWFCIQSGLYQKTRWA